MLVNTMLGNATLVNTMLGNTMLINTTLISGTAQVLRASARPGGVVFGIR
jgi:hypothetical protein